MIQAEDDAKIEDLKQRTGAKSKVEVVRAGLRLLEIETQRLARIERWKKAAQLVAKQSATINHEFQKLSRIHRT